MSWCCNLNAEGRVIVCQFAQCHCAECRYAECHFAECRNAESRYAEYCNLRVILLSDIIQNVVMLRVMAPLSFGYKGLQHIRSQNYIN